MRRRWRLLGVVAALGGLGFLYARYWMGPGPEELARLRQEHAALSARVEARLRGQGSVARAPEGTVLVGVPARAAEKLAGEVVAGLLREVTLTLRDVRVRKEDEVRATLLGRRTLGRFALDLALGEVRAAMRPGKPRLMFARDRIRVALPVTIAEGSGRGRLRLKWDGQGMSGAVCGDFDATLEVAGTVLPVTHILEGTFDLSTEGSTIVARPEFGETKVRVPVQPSQETWRAVEALIDQRGALCRAALKAADLEGKLRSELGHGVVVTLPRNVLTHEIRLPAAIQRPLDMPGSPIQVEVQPTGLTIDPARLWFGATVEVRKLTEVEKPDGPSS